ncbi:MAG: hypothetical protein HZB19_18355 [Chloroflexi bacterium]|nr:hypothetical protein [Chloroflexota bacterium]
MKDEISQIEQRVKRYWYSDGIGELTGGGVFLLLGLYFTAQQYFGDESLAGSLLQTAFIVILIGALFLGRKLINFLKARVTYPRTGYVEYRQSGRNAILMRVLSAVVAMIVAGAAILITRRIDAIDSTVALTGILVGVILVVNQGWSSRMGRFYFLSAASFVLGGVLSVSGLPRGYNLGLFYALMAIAFAVSGGLTLKHYLRENELPLETGNE